MHPGSLLSHYRAKTSLIERGGSVDLHRNGKDRSTPLIESLINTEVRSPPV